MGNTNSFDPLAWVNPANQNGQPRQEAAPLTNPVAAGSPFDGELAKATAVAEELLQRGANIAEAYEDYLQLGFALANGLGAEGRELYHRLCAQSGKYREADCERKWQECLRKSDGRTTIATFYKMAQEAGVDLSAVSRQFPSKPSIPHGEGETAGTSLETGTNCSEETGSERVSMNATTVLSTNDGHSPQGEGLRDLRETATFSETITDRLDLDRLPSLLRMLVTMSDDTEGRDKLLLPSLLLFSGVMPNVFGIYHEKRVHPPFYLIVDAPSGARKGMIDDVRHLVMPIEYELRREYAQEKDDYEQQLAEWNTLDRKQRAGKTEPKPPKYRSLFVAANSSSTSWQQSLSDNHERGIMFETEADTLTQALKQDYSNYSDGLRKAFHHEHIDYSRRTENEHVSIDRPQLAALLTCTPNQIALLLSPNEVENGLASRFLFYNLRGGHEWLDPFANKGEPLSDRIYQVGKLYQNLYGELLQRSERPLQVVLSKQQETAFNDFFRPLLPEQLGLYGESFDAFVYHLGLVTFRLAMVLTVLRCYEHQPMLDPQTQALVCADEDLHTALTIIDCLIDHTAHVYSNYLAKDESVSPAIKAMSANERRLYDALATEFATADCRDVAAAIGITWKSAERYLGFFVSRHHVVQRVSNGKYRKL